MNKKYFGANWQIISAVLLIASLMLGACSQPTEAPLPPTLTPEPSATPEPTVVDYSAAPFVGPAWYWLSTAKSDGSTVTVNDPSVYYLMFNADATYSGKADCNNVAGGYTLDGASLTFLPGISTLAACGEGSQDVDFISGFNATQTYRLEGEFLFLEGSLGTMQFSQTPASATGQYEELDLVGQVWQWLRLDSSDGATTFVPDPSAYVIEFLPDGAIQGVADCNSIGGTYTVAGSSLKIVVSATTLAACPPESLSDQYIQRLGEVATYVMQDGVLYMNLMVDSGNMVFGMQPIALLPEAVEGQPSLTANANLNVRNGPGTNYPVYGVMPSGRTAQVMGKSADGLWWALNLPLAPLGLGWSSAEFATVTGGESVPVMSAPPPPPTAEFSPPGPNDPTVTAIETFYIRSGPGDMYPAYGTVTQGMAGGLIGRSQDSQWWVVRVNPDVISTGAAWVPVAYTGVTNVTDFNSIAVVEAPPPPDQTVPPVPPAGAPTGVAMTSLNVRSGPGTQYAVLAVVAPGTVGEITGKSSDGQWWQVRVPADLASDGFGWVSAAYVYATNVDNVPVIGASPQPTYVVPPPSGNVPPPSGGVVYLGTTTDSVNVYKGPDKASGSYGQIPAGTSSIILERSTDGKWLAFALPKSVSPDGKGWVNSSYVIITEVNSATATAMAPNKPNPTAVPNPNVTPSAPPSSGACKVESVKPVNKTVKPNQNDFDMSVTIKNTGGSAWDPNSIDIKFLSATNNTPYHLNGNVFDLPAMVNPGDSFSFYLDLQAPGTAGSYSESWALVGGGKNLCQWSTSIIVQ